MIEFLFVLSVAGNTWQWLVNDEIKRVNKENAAITRDFESSLTKCSGKLADWQHKESQWEKQRATTERELDKLTAVINADNWGDCRLPVNVDF